MAETTPTTTAKEQIAKANEARQKSQDKAVKMMEQSQPTPTQEENDLARMGVDVVEKEDDGSGPDPTIPTAEDKDKAAAKPARAATATGDTAAQSAIVILNGKPKRGSGLLPVVYRRTLFLRKAKSGD